MHRCQPINGFDFDNQPLINKQIDAERMFHPDTIKLYINGPLTSDMVTHRYQSGRQ